MLAYTTNDKRKNKAPKNFTIQSKFETTRLKPDPNCVVCKKVKVYGNKILQWN